MEPDELRVLLVEDDATDVELALAELRAGGWRVAAEVVASRGELEAALGRARFDVMLADCRLPGWSGLEALEALREAAPEVPCILVTGALGDETAVEYLKRGFADYVLKDRIARLGPAVRRALAECRARDAQRRMQAALRESEEQYRRIFETAGEGIWFLGARGQTLLANHEMAAMLGCTLLELAERSIFDFLEADGRAAVEESLRAEARDRSRRDVRFRLAGGREAWGSLRVTPLINHEARHSGLLAMITDVTDRKQAEEQVRRLNAELENRIQERTAQLANTILALQVRNREVEHANQLKSEFLASVSHELRTPLNTILGFAELLQEGSSGELNEKQRRFAAQILAGAQHLLEVINDILDLSSIEAGKLKLQCEALDARTAVEEALEAVRPLAADKRIAVRLAAGESPAVTADAVRLKQILYNLLSNAVKFTAPGGAVWVELRAEGERAVVAVCDNGVGIAREEQEAIFNEFYQVGTTTRGVKEGTGLGLPITKLLVEQQGGWIRVESEPGQGSRFIFALPAAGDAARGMAGG